MITITRFYDFGEEKILVIRFMGKITTKMIREKVHTQLICVYSMSLAIQEK